MSNYVSKILFSIYDWLNHWNQNLGIERASSDHLPFILLNKNIFCGGSVFDSALIVCESCNLYEGDRQHKSNLSLFKTLFKHSECIKFQYIDTKYLCSPKIHMLKP